MNPRRCISLLTGLAMLLLSGECVFAQRVHGPLYLADRLMSTNRISRGGRIYALANSLGDSGALGNIPVLKVPDGMGPIAMAGDLDYLESALTSSTPYDGLNLIFAEGYYSPSDTLTYYRGRGAWRLRQFDVAVSEFGSMPSSSAFYPSASLYHSLSLAYMDRVEEALDMLEVRCFDGASEDLRKGQIEGFQSILSKDWSRRRSPALAAVMSAIVPGSGKIYAGNLSEGLSALLTVGALAGITAESVCRYGFEDWRSISLAAISGIFYAANIYGSYISVGSTQTIIDNANKAAILLDLRIPLAERSGR